MRIQFLIFCCLISWLAQAQTPVLRPKPITIDLSNPKAGTQGMTNMEKKEWKQRIKQKKKELKLKDRLYEHMLDSAQLANYEKYHGSDSLPPQRPHGVADVMKNMTQDELNRYQSAVKNQYGIPDTVDLTRVNDSTYLQSLDPETQQQLAAYGLPSDSLSMFNSDSLNRFQPNPAGGSLTEEALEGFAQNQLSGGSSDLAGIQQQEQMMFSSYDEMIASDRYQELMKDMPGKKAEIESGFQDRSFDEGELPVAESVFAGHEDKLTAAMETNRLVRKKRSFKDILKQLIDQDMADVKEKSTIQRFSLTGYIQLSNYDPLFIDYSPNISYAFTGKARLGTGVTGRAKIGEGDDEHDKLFAYRGFVEYDILKNIYLHGEYERTGLMVKDPMTDLESRQWDGHWLLGLGTDISFPGIFKGTLLILYNFDDDLANSANPRRFHIRYGIKL